MDQKEHAQRKHYMRCKKRPRKRDHRCSLSLFFFCRVLLERRERNRDCFYGNGYISRDVFVNFLSPFCKKNGPKMTSSTKFKRCRIQCSLFVYTTKKLQGLVKELGFPPHNTKKTHSREGRRIARKSDYDERETTGADVLRRKTTTERRRRRRRTTTKSRSS